MFEPTQAVRRAGFHLVDLASSGGEHRVGHAPQGVGSTARAPHGEHREGAPSVRNFYRYWCGIYHFFDCFLMWYGNVKSGMVLVCV